MKTEPEKVPPRKKRRHNSAKGEDMIRNRSLRDSEQTNIPFYLSASGHICRFFKHKILDVALLRLRFCSIRNSKYDPNPCAKLGISAYSKSLIVIGVLLLLTACADKKNLIILTPGATGEIGALQIRNEKGDVVLDQENPAVYVRDERSQPFAPATLSASETGAIFGDALAAQPLPPESFLLYFEFDSYILTAESSQLVDRILQAIHDRDSQDIAIIGHTDRAGDEEYNQTLSLGRAQVVRDLLVAKGINSEFIQVLSYGEGNSLIPTADDVPEAKNRRVEVVVR